MLSKGEAYRYHPTTNRYCALIRIPDTVRVSPTRNRNKVCRVSYLPWGGQTLGHLGSQAYQTCIDSMQGIFSYLHLLHTSTLKLRVSISISPEQWKSTFLFWPHTVFLISNFNFMAQITRHTNHVYNCHNEFCNSSSWVTGTGTRGTLELGTHRACGMCA